MYDDAIRTSSLEKSGFKVIRFSNEEVLYNTQDTLNKIKQHIDMNTKELDKSLGAVSPSLTGRDGVGLSSSVPPAQQPW
jgi:hypothetical protein